MINFKFPNGFLWGTATSSFQIEGGAFADGKGESIWDAASRDYPNRFWKGQTPQNAAGFYHKYVDDIKMMKSLGLKSFRMSIAWPRIFPEGYGTINQKGIDFYNRIIDNLIENDIEPFVDIYHWDLPQALAEKGGFKNPEIINWFINYAEVCFKNYGDRVKLWSTMNEPSVMAFTHYRSGVYPPFEKDLKNALSAAHNIILAHYATVKLYKGFNFNGKIGAVIAFVPVYPATLSQEDIDAATRQEDIVCNWWLRPMFEGKYPDSVIEYPEYSEKMPENYNSELEQGFAPIDFIGINYYNPARTRYKPGNNLDSENVENFYAQSDYGFTIYPQGLFDSMVYIKDKYNNPEIFITENGIANENYEDDNKNIHDDFRIDYLREHLRELLRCIRIGVNIKGYYYWSHFDTYEATSGYRYRFGLLHVDFNSLKRTPKKSWNYYKRIIENNGVE